MRRITTALILVLALAAAAFAQAADAKAKAEAILKQARAAIGDEKKLKDLQALSATGTVRQTFGENQFESELEIEMMTPDKIRKVTNSQMGGTNITVFDGTQVWRDNIPPIGGGGGNFVRFGDGGGRGGQGAFGGPGGPGGQNSPMAAYMQLQQRRELYQIMLGWLLTAPSSAQLQFSFVGEAPGPEGSKLDVLDGKGADGLNVRLYLDQQTHQLVGLSYKGKSMTRGFRGGPGRPGGGPGGGQAGAQGGQRPPQGAQPGAAPGQPGQPAQPTQPTQPAQPGQAGQAGQPGQRPQISPEERERRMKEAMEAFEKSPDVDFRWAFSEYKSAGGLNLPHRLTKMEGNTPNEEWEISKFKLNPKLLPDKFVKKEKTP